ncbi:hypothetical protein [Halobacteriaceae bacterium SHR40]|uniref:hypothetical protein n=1 Tax=Halovenus amylolytica TaxID=2500550 RepID=UPI000FE2FF20
MDRRAFLFAATGAAATAGLAGCLGAPGSDPQPENVPEQAVEQYFRALADGDRAAREAILHSENPELAQLAQTGDGDSQTFDLALQETTVVEREGERAIVDVTVRFGDQSVTNGLELRVEDNRWKIWGTARIDRQVSDPIPDDPVGVVVQYFEAVDLNDVDRMERLVHAGGPLAADRSFDESAVSEVSAAVVDASLVKQTDGSAVVEATLRTISDGRAVDQQNRIRLRTEDGGWRLWNWVETADSGITAGIPEEPEAIVEQYFLAFDVADLDRVRELEHAESPGGLSEGISDEQLGAYLDSVDIIVEETRLVSESDEEAVVEVTVTTVVDSGQTNTSAVVLRRDDAEWRIWRES